MKPPPSGILVLTCGWMLAAGSGFLVWGAYHATPGRPGSPRPVWPSAARVPLDSTRPTLLIFLDPRCPCSAASVAELARLVERNPDQVAAHAVVRRISGDLGRLDARLDAIPGLRRWDDPNGVEAGRLGVETSGHVLLYGPSGGLLFSGGITLARGHEGENPGLDRLIESARTRTAESRPGPVFGCLMDNPLGTMGRELIR